MGDKTIEEVLGSSGGGKTIEEVLGASHAPLGEYGPNGQLYQMGTGNMPGSYGSADLLQNPPQTWGELGKQALRTGALVGGAVGGGMAGRAIGEAVPLLSKAWSPIMSSAGTAAGQFVGDVATGGNPADAAIGAGQTGLLNLGVEGGMNLAARGTGKVGNVGNNSINAALNRGPIDTANMVWTAPAKDAELQLAQKLQGQLRPENPPAGSVNLSRKTPARLRAESKMRQFDAANPVVPSPNIGTAAKGGIDTGPIKAKILSMVKPNSLETGQQSINAYLSDKASSLPDTMTAKELDQFITEHSKPLSKSFGVQQVPLPTEVKQGMLSAARQVRNASVPSAKGDFAKASNQLNAMKRTARQFLEPTGEVKQGAVEKFKGILDAQWMRDVLTKYEDQTGNKILEEADNLAYKRDWTKEDRGHAGRLWWIAERFLAKPLARTAATFARPAGQTASAVSAFQRAMENNP